MQQSLAQSYQIMPKLGCPLAIFAPTERGEMHHFIQLFADVMQLETLGGNSITKKICFKL